jgi:pimeloyl-ACP methyl ester carboxylesterase
MVTEGFVEVDRARLHYLEWGDRRRPHVLLLHGWDGTAHYWDLVAPAFADRYHLVALTLRGRGRSDGFPDGPYDFHDYGRDVRTATERLGLDRMIFVGASLGGMVGLAYTAAHVDQVERLVLGDIGAQLGGDRPSSYYTGMLDAPESFASPDEIERWLRQWSLYARIPDAGMAIVIREHFAETSPDRWTWTFAGPLRQRQRSVPRDVLFPPQWATLSKIACPVLIVRGGRSESLLPDVAERTRAGLHNSLLVEIPDCSHFPFLERPRELSVLLRGFLP